MASNVFGTPISNETLKSLPEFHDKQNITQSDRARVAMEMKNAEGKDQNAKKMAEYLCYERYGDEVCTMGLIYNATGNAITLVSEHDWEGHLTLSSYPTIIYNGQWGIFVHGKYGEGRNYSKAAIVYSGKNSAGVDRHWCLAFANNRWFNNDNNRVYVEVNDPNRFSDSYMPTVLRNLDNAPNLKRMLSSVKQPDAYMTGAIGNYRICSVEAILTLPSVISLL